MKLKASAIAVAVAGTLATPMAAQADVYASVRVGVENVDTGGVSDLRTRSFGSRFGVKSETDLGNGMTAFGRYEWDVDFTDHNEDVVDRSDALDTTLTSAEQEAGANAGDKDDIDVRLRYVGVKGDFGSVRLGQDYHTYYNFINAPVDNPWWASGYQMVNYRSRTDNGVTYAGGTDMFNFGVTAYFEREAEEDAPDAIELAGSFGIGDMTLGIGLQTVPSDVAQGSAGNDEDIVGVTLSGIMLGDASIGVNFESQDDDSSIVLDVGFGNFIAHYEVLDSDAGDNDPSLFMVGYTHNLGRGTALWGELVTIDADTSDSDDDTDILRVVLKYDIL